MDSSIYAAENADKVEVEIARVEELLSRISSSQDHLYDQIALVSAAQGQFAEKLLILNGGTITLSLTVIGLLGPHISLEKVEYIDILYAAWWLHACSMIFCIWTQLVGGLVPGLRAFIKSTKALDGLLGEFETTLKASKFDELRSLGFPKRALDPAFEKTTWKSQLRLNSTVPAAVIFMVLGYLALLVFAQINLNTVFGAVK